MHSSGLKDTTNSTNVGYDISYNSTAISPSASPAPQTQTYFDAQRAQGAYQPSSFGCNNTNTTNTGYHALHNNKVINSSKSKIIKWVYAQSFLMYLATFAVAFGMSRFRPFNSEINNRQLYLAIALPAIIAYLVLSCWKLPKIEAKIKANEKYNSSVNGLVVALPVLLGVAIVPVFLQFQSKEIFAAMAGALSIGGTAALFGLFTDSDLSKPTHFVASCVVALLIASLVNIFILKNNFLEIGISAGFILVQACILAYNSQEMKNVIEAKSGYKGVSPENEGQFRGYYSLNISNSLVSITLELLNIKKNKDEISAREY